MGGGLIVSIFFCVEIFSSGVEIFKNFLRAIQIISLFHKYFEPSPRNEIRDTPLLVIDMSGTGSGWTGGLSGVWKRGQAAVVACFV